MKKLMIAAAAMAMIGGAFAADGAYAGVYNLKYNLKTIVPKTYSCGKEKITCTICTTIVERASTAWYYENGTVKIEGLIAYCDPCEKVGEDYQKAVLALWDASHKVPVYFDDCWQTAQTVYDVTNCPVSNVFAKIDAVVYGKTSTKVAVDTIINYSFKTDAVVTGVQQNVDSVIDLRATGLGSYAWNKDDDGYIKSVNGNVAGVIPAWTGFDSKKNIHWAGLVVDNVCEGAVKFACVSGTVGTLANTAVPMADVKSYKLDEKDALVVPAYGTWTMKFNQSATGNTNGLKAALPTWLRNY